ncbi:MAG TPA: hypothetical protein PLR60_04460 [Syntrophorhabdaceae bacterium]|nr:hypothetical protein [Syntrophorhabdaceae bacterium]
MNTNRQTQQANEELNRQCRDAAEKLGKIMERLNNRAAEWITRWVKEDMPCVHEEVSHDDGWIYFFRDGTDPGNEYWEWILELAGSQNHDIKGLTVLPGRGGGSTDLGKSSNQSFASFFPPIRTGGWTDYRKPPRPSFGRIRRSMETTGTTATGRKKKK